MECPVVKAAGHFLFALAACDPDGIETAVKIFLKFLVTVVSG
jgi:hypothetical protein